MSEDFEQIDLSEKDLLSDASDLNLDDFLDSETANVPLNSKEDHSNQDDGFAELFSSDNNLDEILSEEIEDVVAFDDADSVSDIEKHDVAVDRSDDKESAEKVMGGAEVIDREALGAHENAEDEQNADTEVANNAQNVRQEQGVETNNSYVRWYDGESSEPQYEIDKNSESQTLSGTDDCRSIHINIGFDAYGWLVRFVNGVVMSVSDVREYQLRNGALPDSTGVITYANTQIEFQNIEKIKIYESVRYFTYA